MDGNTALMLCAVQKLREPISNKRTWKPMNIEVLNIILTFPYVCHLWRMTPLWRYEVVLSLIISYLPSHFSIRNPFHCIKRFSLLWKQLFHIFSQFLFHKTGVMWFLHSNIILSYPEERHPFISILVLPQRLHDNSVQKASYWSSNFTTCMLNTFHIAGKKNSVVT